MISNLSHVTLVVADLERSAAFYRDVLGFTEVPTPPSFTHAVRWFVSGSAELHLIAARDAPQEPGDKAAHPDPSRDIGRARHVAFGVADLEGMLARLRRRGVQVLLGPRPRGDGVTQMYCMDPDGHLIELHTPYEVPGL
ncbi:Glyoxalase/bleomycin resistance protein/dioxygenase [Thermobaculum terrenum ATCC BAA-798]|uniref:Glyoxalase/bleomycin resistance protein/dioxygenase n=1 Tax=Thermobaculum terrenum (strain ATCC BAA-798 / CCMEE 7001 / YNP1) TaxID=525904 RepID=D1CHE6_THET1|nr:VOC family protein [Thermobaculum terrenum]ACZ43167.1 Glyoxalase/bleomycin resistance protein/dioxygenase [Thermobaculum terrenum ATCC BAA-798]